MRLVSPGGRYKRHLQRMLDRAPILLMVNGRLQAEAARRVRVVGIGR
jgi:hypothetical protein